MWHVTSSLEHTGTVLVMQTYILWAECGGATQCCCRNHFAGGAEDGILKNKAICQQYITLMFNTIQINAIVIFIYSYTHTHTTSALRTLLPLFFFTCWSLCHKPHNTQIHIKRRVQCFLSSTWHYVSCLTPTHDWYFFLWFLKGHQKYVKEYSETTDLPHLAGTALSVCRGRPDLFRVFSDGP